jgi:hypothetical protein
MAVKNLEIIGDDVEMTWISSSRYLAETEIHRRKDDGKNKSQTNLDRQCPILITNNSHLSFTPLVCIVHYLQVRPLNIFQLKAN